MMAAFCPETERKRFGTVLLLLYTVQGIFGENDVEQGCENSEVTIMCTGANEIIDITDVLFGRENNDFCQGTNSDTTTTCRSTTAQASVEALCEDKPTCTLTINTAMLGGEDPCSGVFKQFEATYCCYVCTSVQRTMCENEELTITCGGANEVINIIDVVFGRVNNDVCVGANSDTTTTCISTTAQAAVEALCEDQPTCTLTINTAMLGGEDPCPGVFKQLLTTYCCYDACERVTCTSPRTCSFGICECPTGTAEPNCNTCTNVQTSACENEQLSITCSGANEVIANTDVVFGRVNNDNCVGANSDTVTDCVSTAAPAAVQSACEGQHACSFIVNTANLGGTDPCSGVFKQMILDYCCVDLCVDVTCSLPRVCSFGTCECPTGTVEPDCSAPANPVTSNIACEGGILQITCSTGTIKILDAFYGRDNNDQCPGANSDVTTDCSLNTVTSIVETNCQQMSQCSLDVSSTTFTDPCPGTFKYLEVQYICALPTISCPGDIQEECDPSTCSSIVTWNDPQCDDGFGGPVTVTCTPNSGQSWEVGSDFTVSCTCLDQLGHTDTCSFQVIVTDPTYVVITSNPQHSWENQVSGVLAVTNVEDTSIAISKDEYRYTRQAEKLYFESSEPFGKRYQVTAPTGQKEKLYGSHKVTFTASNGQETLINTFIKRKTDRLDTRGVYTLTIYPDQGDAALLDKPLQFGVQGLLNDIVWYKDGKRLAQTGPSMKLIETDGSAGIYTLQRRGRGKGAWCVQIQVILSDCPRGFFTDDPSSPCAQPCACGSCPGSEAQCPCLNGGVCEADGKCRCPPCFTGRYCEKAKSNVYEIIAREQAGSIVRFTCDDVAEQDGDCRCNLFCYGGNYGCSCGCGWRGNNCNKKCGPGWFGADCKQKCNCLSNSQCNRVTGACKGGCPAGFIGFNCQKTISTYG